jgi:hypothetical protein
MPKSGVKTKPASDSQNSPKGEATGVEPMDAGSMDKIRDILFGNQMRDYERRFARMEEQIADTIQDLRDETHKRLGALELFFKEEMAAIQERLKTEEELRSQGDQGISDEMKNVSAALSKNLVQTNDKFAERATELRRQILEQSKQLTSEIQTKYEQTAKELKQTATGLADAKVDRSSLAEYLIQIAMNLSDHSAGPGAI